MRWIDKLERKFGRFAIRNLMLYIVSLNLAVFLLRFLDITGTFYSRLYLVPSLVMKGEVWRLITYVFLPPTDNIIWILLTLYFYYMIGTSLEREWGSFRFNVYYFIGMLCTTISAFIISAITNSPGYGVTGVYLNTSLFLAFAQLFPYYEILIFFILPVKIKYLAWIEWAFIALTVVFFPLPQKLAAIASVVNFFVFFGQDFIGGMRLRRQVYDNRRRFHDEIRKAEQARKKWNK